MTACTVTELSGLIEGTRDPDVVDPRQQNGWLCQRHANAVVLYAERLTVKVIDRSLPVLPQCVAILARGPRG
jgi:hypothetical protein